MYTFQSNSVIQFFTSATCFELRGSIVRKTVVFTVFCMVCLYALVW